MQKASIHAHEFHHDNAHGERRTLQVLGITLVTMLVEIVAGFSFNSMALTADGWHMGTHAAAFSITLFAYYYARKHANNPRFSFGTGKVSVLGGFASAVGLAMVALLMSVESIRRLVEPQDIRFNEAIGVAVLGLAVNIASAFLLKDSHHHKGHDHHHDHNLKAAYLHVLADALTSVAAIIALTFGRIFGWVVLDPIMGLVGALVITKWAMGLIMETSGILLDGSVEPEVCNAICAAVDAEPGCHITDLHVWEVAPDHLAVILCVETSTPRKPEEIKLLLSNIPHLAHITVELHSP